MGHKQKGMDSKYLNQLDDDMPQYKKAIEELKYDLDFTKIKIFLDEEMAWLKGIYREL